MRTNKQNRLAYNFTKMARYIENVKWNKEFQEAAKDAGLAMIAYGHICDDAEQEYVFVPQKEWNKVSARFNVAKRYGLENPDGILVGAASYWYRMAQLHNP